MCGRLRVPRTEDMVVKALLEIISHRSGGPRRGLAHGQDVTARLRRDLGHLLLAALVLTVAAVVWSTWEQRAELAYNQHNLIRLHVVANSDQPADQVLKVKVRDAILAASGDLLGESTPADAEARIVENLPLFRRLAEEVVRQAGRSYGVEVEYGTFAFPERSYGPVDLPAGEYRALRVVLGNGDGANWWCILFPPLCYLDVVGGGGGHEAVPLSTLTEEQRRRLEELTEAADVSSVVRLMGRDYGLGVVPAGEDGSGTVLLVADTGTDDLQVRLYTVERLRDVVRALAEAFPWLFGGAFGPAVAEEAANPER